VQRKRKIPGADRKFDLKVRVSPSLVLLKHTMLQGRMRLYLNCRSAADVAASEGETQGSELKFATLFL